MKIWKAHYIDEHHDLDIDILNTEEDYSSNPLSFCINGITFSGTCLNDFELANPKLYEKVKNEFQILKHGGKATNDEYYYNLQRYSLDVVIPLSLLRKADQCVVQGDLHIFFQLCEHDKEQHQAHFSCDDETVYLDDVHIKNFSLSIDGEEYSVDAKDLYFESNFLKLCKMIKDKYELRCCFTCQYSDYSPYGNDDYGTMLCFRKHKSEYLKVNNKDDFFQYLFHLDFERRQETYLCEEYEVRNRCEGYRGFI